MRGNVGRVADRDAAGPVDQQIRDSRGKHERFLQGFVVVGTEIHRLFVDIGEQLFGQLRHARFGVPHGGGGIAVHRPVVPLAVHQRIAHVEVLRHTDQGVVDRRVAMGMVVTHDLTDDFGRLAIGAIMGQAHFIHAEENTAMDRLEPVAHVRKRPPYDYAHGVVEVRRLHFIFNRDIA